MENVDSDLLAIDLGFVLKSEQKEAAGSLLEGKDVFRVLPTGFGNSLIYQLFVLAGKTNQIKEDRTADNHCHLFRITEEQIVAVCELRFNWETLTAIREITA